jgi:ribosomal protein S18 acetylase RimI-like enzyme
MAQVQIRPCTPQDLDAVLRLERHWEQEDIAYGDFNPMSREMFSVVLERFPDYFLVADQAGQLVGYIHGTVHHTTRVEVIPAQEPYIEIENIYVLPDYRSRAIGSALLGRLVAVAQAAGIARFTVGTRSKATDRILRFYGRHGFTPWSIQFVR